MSSPLNHSFLIICPSSIRCTPIRLRQLQRRRKETKKERLRMRRKRNRKQRTRHHMKRVRGRRGRKRAVQPKMVTCSECRNAKSWK